MTAAFPQTGFAHTVVVWSDDDRPLDKDAVDGRAEPAGRRRRRQRAVRRPGGVAGRLRTGRPDGHGRPGDDRGLQRRRRRRTRSPCCATTSRQPLQAACRAPGAGDRDDRRVGRLRRRPAAHLPFVIGVRARADLRGAGAGVPVGRRRGDRGGAQPAVGRRGVRPAGADLPARLRADLLGVAVERRRSSTGCRCSCSSSCSGCRWTTTCSSSAGSARRTTLGEPTRAAVARGVTASAGVVTSAAAVMVGVFSIFGTLSLLEFKQLGRRSGGGGADRRDHRAGRAAALGDDAAGTAQLVAARLAGPAAARWPLIVGPHRPERTTAA